MTTTQNALHAVGKEVGTHDAIEHNAPAWDREPAVWVKTPVAFRHGYRFAYATARYVKG